MLVEILDVAVAAAIPTLGVAVAWGRVTNGVKNMQKELDGKAEKDVVDVKFDAIIERLERMENKMDRNTRNGNS